MLNEFFTSTFTKEYFDTIPAFQDREFVTCLDDISIDVSTVKDKLFNLNPTKATGLDGLPARVLKEVQV